MQNRKLRISNKTERKIGIYVEPVGEYTTISPGDVVLVSGIVSGEAEVDFDIAFTDGGGPYSPGICFNTDDEFPFQVEQVVQKKTSPS